MKQVIETCVEKLEHVFMNNIADFFFTEKELHSYFLNICFSQTSLIHNGYLVIHAEYPTPFKCSYNDNDIFRLERDDAKKIRAHIDMVFLNHNFIDWISSQKLANKYLSGISQTELFTVFSKDLAEKYRSFYSVYKEPILSFAFEFKYLRHGYLGTKHPVKGIIQDLEKLKLLRTFPTIKHNNTFCFVENTLSLIFIGERGNYIIDNLKDALINYRSNEYRIITKNQA